MKNLFDEKPLFGTKPLPADPSLPTFVLQPVHSKASGLLSNRC